MSSTTTIDALVDELRQSGKAASAAPARSGRVVVVDDNRESSSTMRELLAERCDVSVCADPTPTALRELLQGDACLVLLDIKMAPRGGVDVFKTIRELAPRVPIAFLSAYPGEHDIVAAIDGLDHAGYFVKGECTLDALLQLVDDALSIGGRTTQAHEAIP